MGVVWLGCFCVCLVVWVLFFVCVSIPGRFSKQSLQFPVVDRPCLVLVRIEESRWLENSYKGLHWRWVQQQWKNCRAWFACQAVAQSPSQWVSTLYLHGLDQLDALSWQWITQHENLVEQVWHTRQGTYRRKRPPDVRDDPMRCQ